MRKSVENLGRTGSDADGCGRNVRINQGNLKKHQPQKDNIAEIIEETADVEIMLEQLKANYGIEEKVAAYKAGKLNLIEQRLNEWDKKTA